MPPGTLPPSDSSLDQLTATTHSTTSTCATTAVASTTVQNVLASDTLSYDARANSALSTGRMLLHHSAFSVVPVSETMHVSAVTAPSLITPGLIAHGVPTAQTSSGAARSLQPTVALTGHRQDAVQAPIVPGRGVSAVQTAPLLPQGNLSTVEPVCNHVPTLPVYMLSTDDDSDSSVSLPATQPIRPSRTASRQWKSTVAMQTDAIDLAKQLAGSLQHQLQEAANREQRAAAEAVDREERVVAEARRLQQATIDREERAAAVAADREERARASAIAREEKERQQTFERERMQTEAATAREDRLFAQFNLFMETSRSDLTTAADLRAKTARLEAQLEQATAAAATAAAQRMATLDTPLTTPGVPLWLQLFQILL